ncbi:serine protease [Tenacibaculum holothuriorum]|uniref:Serine protease n=1 Tax=Tenacibaculum holothuriorum TaxID=1635173 RepID=A0A1Y2PDE8_9FLAO|nr:trypsin-like peptidase domain-containing protein [Tenacibaculum holothuriorum]OSY87759.1 serine protease [Tenacibaculum holothuriorum]
MKKIFGLLSIAILGGVFTLGGYKMLIEKPVVVETTSQPTLQTVKANYSPAMVSNTEALPTNFTEAAEKTVNAVVHVKNTAVRTQQDPYSFFFGGNGTRERKQVGTGSGVIISPDGYIVTNNHVIKDAVDIEITLNNRKKVKAELIGADESNDIALLKIDVDGALPNLPFGNSDNAKIGEWVLAVGNPYNLTSTVTAGIVSAKGRDLEGNGTNIDSFIQTDAAVNPGNSGGALVNTRGELIGINTAISSRTGSFIGYSFAVPSNIAKKIIDDLLEYGSVQEALIGFVPELKNQDEIKGVKIASIDSESGASKAGLREGDIITGVNNVEIRKFSDLKGQLKAKRPGELIDVTIDRDGEEMIKTVALTKRVVLPISSRLNTEFEDLNSKDKKKFNITGGAKIKRTANPIFKEFEVGEGYILTKVNGQKVNSAAEAVQVLDNNYNKRLILEMISPSGQLERFRY